MMTLPVFGQGSCNCTAPEVSESVSSPLDQATALPAECSRWVGSLAPSMTLLSPIQNLLLHLVSSFSLSTWSSSHLKALITLSSITGAPHGVKVSNEEKVGYQIHSLPTLFQVHRPKNLGDHQNLHRHLLGWLFPLPDRSQLILPIHCREGWGDSSELKVNSWELENWDPGFKGAAKPGASSSACTMEWHTLAIQNLG